MVMLSSGQENRYPAQERGGRGTIGTFKGDPIMEDICEEALRMREEERRQFQERERAG